MYKDHRVSLVIPAYNEEGTIGAVLDDFKGSEPLDEIVVVDNNSSDGTAAAAAKHGVRVITETRQGYGNALRCGMDAAEGDILILTEADGSFKSADVIKFLAYVDDADLVMGTRTAAHLVVPGARMNRIIRMANITVGKFCEGLWVWSNPTRLSDVGCTYRAIWKSAYQKIRPNLIGVGPEFSPEMMAEAMRAGLRIVEIPVNYGLRSAGESKHSTTYGHLARTAWKMIRMILKKRVGF